MAIDPTTGLPYPPPPIGSDPTSLGPLSKLNLTEDQRTQIRAIANQFKQQVGNSQPTQAQLDQLQNDINGV